MTVISRGPCVHGRACGGAGESKGGREWERKRVTLTELECVQIPVTSR